MTTILVRSRRPAITALLIIIAGCARSGPQGASPSSESMVGPPRGALVVVGGGTLGPEIYKKFIELAGGPDALILDVPTAGGAPTYPAETGTTAQFKSFGAKTVMVLHTYDRKIADSDSFVAPIKRAGGVWFDGGRHYRLVDAYAGTKSEKEFHAVLARGGVTGGSSAGASILGSYLVRGAPSNDNRIMAYPGYETGFGFLRGTGVDQHVVARERLPDLADSIMPKRPELLLISEDEGTAWVVQGDNAEIIGRSKAFAYNGRETDPGTPFLTLWPGDRYNLAERRVTRRAIDDSPLTRAFVDSLFQANVGAAMATVLVAQAGKILVNSSYNVPPQRRYQPTTTMPSFPLGGISAPLNAVIATWLAGQNRLSLDDPIEDGGSVTVRQCLGNWFEVANCDLKLTALFARKGGATYAQLAQRRVTGPAGMPRTTVDSTNGAFRSNVDELYRTELAHFAAAESADNGSVARSALGWRQDRHRDQARLAAYGTRDGRRAAFVRYPDRRVAILVLTDSDAIDARAIVDRVADALFRTR